MKKGQLVFNLFFLVQTPAKVFRNLDRDMLISGARTWGTGREEGGTRGEIKDEMHRKEK